MKPNTFIAAAKYEGEVEIFTFDDQDNMKIFMEDSYKQFPSVEFITSETFLAENTSYKGKFYYI